VLAICDGRGKRLSDFASYALVRTTNQRFTGYTFILIDSQNRLWMREFDFAPGLKLRPSIALKIGYGHWLKIEQFAALTRSRPIIRRARRQAFRSAGRV
jgi:hypothetical protein